MKTINVISLIFIVFSIISCTPPTIYPSAMQQAESIMAPRPDSALVLLEGMEDSISIYPEETQMYWYLLTIQAKDKLYITHTGDSLINSIVKFYNEAIVVNRKAMFFMDNRAKKAKHRMLCETVLLCIAETAW